MDWLWALDVAKWWYTEATTEFLTMWLMVWGAAIGAAIGLIIGTVMYHKGKTTHPPLALLCVGGFSGGGAGVVTSLVGGAALVVLWFGLLASPLALPYIAFWYWAKRHYATERLINTPPAAKEALREVVEHQTAEDTP